MAEEEYLPCCSLEVHKSVENVANSPTLVFHIGRESHSEYCAVMVTGNPGMIEFYEVFMLQLHKASSCHLEVVGISQAGKLSQKGKALRSFRCISGGFKGVQVGANALLREGNSALAPPFSVTDAPVRCREYLRGRPKVHFVTDSGIWPLTSDTPAPLCLTDIHNLVLPISLTVSTRLLENFNC